MKMRKSLGGYVLPVFSLVALSLFSMGSGCPTATQTAIEEAQASLDKCNPADSSTVTFCQNVVDLLDAIVTADPTNNVQAAILESSAYLGLAGVDFLQFVSKLTETGGTGGDFQAFLNLVGKVEKDNGRTINTTNLGLAVSQLNAAIGGKTGTASADLTDLEKRAAFQLGAVQSLQTFILPAKVLTFSTSGDTSTVTSSSITAANITTAVASTLKKDFVNADNNLGSSGTTDTKTLSAVRVGYCRCAFNGPTATGDNNGYNATCLRDLLRCNLTTTDASEATEQDYAGTGVKTDHTAQCAALNSETSTKVADCKTNGTTE